MDDERPSKRGRFDDGSIPPILKQVKPVVAMNGSGSNNTPSGSGAMVEKQTHPKQSDNLSLIFPDELESIGIKELLEIDTRPTFILDFRSPEMITNHRLNAVFCNIALKFFDDLRNVVAADTYYPSSSTNSTSASPSPEIIALEDEFREWASEDSSTEGYCPRHTFREMLWTSTMLRNRWRVISASHVPHQRKHNHGTPKSSGTTSRSTSSTRPIPDPLDPEYLKNQLADSMSKFRVLTELNPVGMYYLSPDGDILYCNDMWYEITGHPKGLEGKMSFMNVISEIDHPKITEEWILLTTQRGARSFALRLRNPSTDSQGNKRQKWILCSCDQEWDEDGNLLTIMGCITDISEQKAAEEHALARAQLVEALAEAKRHQENFIDMTSHEMRNPLSAMLMCADGIANSLIDFKSSTDKTAIISQELVDNNLEAAQTIILCAQHQKRIIDDVLTLSKLNSKMLDVTPVQVDVEGIVRRTMKLFESEFAADDIKMTFTIEDSYKKAKIDEVFCDPVRLTQIFINLLTNAIKFTRSEEERQIEFRIGASSSKPPKDAAPAIQWFPSRDSAEIQDLVLGPEWGTGEEVYLYFAVRDTGRGLDEFEKTRLFHRFSQASPRTHVQYGGSGLGLFISRELTELQGGEIGCASTAGEGSTFAFYIKGRKTTQPSGPEPITTASKCSPTSTLPKNTTKLSEPFIPPPIERARHNYQILLVEDNLINQKVLSKQLRNSGCTVYVANHGVEALNFLEKTSLWANAVDKAQLELSLILMDLEMPIMDGLTCARRIRELEQDRKLIGHTPIIAVTANARVEQMEVAMAAGMDDIVPKPFQMLDLMQKMEKWCEN